MTTDATPVRRTPPTDAVFTLALVAWVAALAWFQSPAERFTRYIAFDSGVDLTMQNLIARGFRPTVDFGVAYGLLPLLVNRAWYALNGLTPAAFRLGVFVATALTAWGMARFARATRANWPGRLLIALAIPDVMFPSFSTIVHALEPALLVHGLAEQANGRRSRALAFATASVLVKPSMGYVYGAVLLLWTAADVVRSGQARDPRQWLRALAPAALTGLTLAALIALVFGPGPLLDTLLPTKGAAIYRIYGFGFFQGVGRAFWKIPNATFFDYFRYEVGFWIIVSLWLVAEGLARLARGPKDMDSELVVTCATLHAVFVTCFFGMRMSWTYYFSILILGTTVLSKLDRRRLAFGAFLAFLLLINDRSKLLQTYRDRALATPHAETLGLWVTPAELAEWRTVLDLTHDHPPALLTLIDGSSPLVPRFLPPAAAYLCPGLTLPSEVTRKAAQLRDAEFIVSLVPPDWEGFTFWPEMSTVLEGRTLVFSGQTFRVYRRAGPGAGLIPLGSRGRMPQDCSTMTWGRSAPVL